MLSTFTLLMAAGVGFRLALSHLLQRHYDLRVVFPPALAAVFLVLSGIPDWLSPVWLPLPLSLTVGLALPDLLTRRA